MKINSQHNKMKKKEMYNLLQKHTLKLMMNRMMMKKNNKLSTVDLPTKFQNNLFQLYKVYQQKMRQSLKHHQDMFQTKTVRHPSKFKMKKKMKKMSQYVETQTTVVSNQVKQEELISQYLLEVLMVVPLLLPTVSALAKVNKKHFNNSLTI